jgi:hypothetical protein
MVIGICRHQAGVLFVWLRCLELKLVLAGLRVSPCLALRELAWWAAPAAGLAG